MVPAEMARRAWAFQRDVDDRLWNVHSHRREVVPGRWPRRFTGLGEPHQSAASYHPGKAGRGHGEVLDETGGLVRGDAGRGSRTDLWVAG